MPQPVEVNSGGIIIEADTTTEVLDSVWTNIKSRGKEYTSQRGQVKSLKAVTMIIHRPLDETSNYPYWNQVEDVWYQNNFVRKGMCLPPEIIEPHEDIYPYKYSWRSRYYDGGTGYVKRVVSTLRGLGYDNISFQQKSELEDLLKASFQSCHPETIMAVLAWKRKALLNFYLRNPQILDLELQADRRDTLLSVIEEVKQNPSSRRAITPSFTYESIDHSGVAGGVPVYQNYQLYVDFDRTGNPTGLISMHLHRAMDAMGGTQLDINHDKEWGLIASKRLGAPLKTIIIYCNDIYHHVPTEGANIHLAQKTNIKDWLFSVTDAYDPKTEDIEKRLASKVCQDKISHTLRQFNS